MSNNEAKLLLASDFDCNIKNETVNEEEESNSENEPTLSPTEELQEEVEKKRSSLRHSQRLLKRQTFPNEIPCKKSDVKRSAEAIAVRRAKRARGQSSSDNDSDAHFKGIRSSLSPFKASSLSSSTLSSVNIRQQKVIQNDEDSEDDEHDSAKREKHCSCGVAYDPKK